MNPVAYSISRQTIIDSVNAKELLNKILIGQISTALKCKREVIDPIYKAWAESLRLLEEKLSPPKRLIEIENGMVRCKSKVGSNTVNQGAMLLTMIIEDGKDYNFMSYDEIEKKFVENGLEPLHDRKKMLDRIHHAIEHIKRFIIREDQEYKGETVIKTVEHKGVRIYNPLMKK